MLTVINIIFQNKHLFPLFLCTTSLVTLRMLSLFQCKYCPCRWLIWLLHCSSRNRNHLFNFLALAIRFCHPRHNGQWPPTLQLKDFYPRFYPLHYFPIFILQKETVFPFFIVECQTRELLVPFYNVFGMTRSLTGDWTWDLPHLKPALYH